MKLNLISLIVTTLCGFCHAPRHAYEELIEHPEINRDDLCPEAQERVRMAAAPEPPDAYGIAYAWNEKRHEYVKAREYGACATCGALTWRFGDQTCPHECKACQKAFIERAQAEHLAKTGEPLPSEMVNMLRAGRPRHSEPPAPHFPLIFSDYEVRNTRIYEGLPGPRYGKPRPRIVFGSAVLPAWAQERNENRKARELAWRAREEA